MILGIATAILFLTTEKCNRGCNSGSFLNLHSETSTELNAARKKHRNKTISPKYTLIIVGIQQQFSVCAEMKNLGFELVGV